MNDYAMTGIGTRGYLTGVTAGRFADAQTATSTLALDPRLEHLFRFRTPLLKALRGAGDCYTIGDVADGILSGRFQYWMSDAAGIVTEILAYPRKRALNYFLAFGELNAILAMQPEIEAFAREHGCAAVACSGRDGWARPLAKHDWKKKWTVYVKELSP